MAGRQDQPDQSGAPVEPPPAEFREARAYKQDDLPQVTPPDRVPRGDQDLHRRMERLPPGHPSSPYDDNGARNPPVPRLKDLELPLPDESDVDSPDLTDQEPQPADPEDRNGNSQDFPLPTADDTHQQGTQSWREEAPGFHEPSANFQEDRRGDARSPFDRSRDEPGSWRGDSGRHLPARENREINTACEQVANCEVQITKEVESTEQVAAGKLVGKEHRLKGRDRLKDKVAAAREDAPEAKLDRLIENIHDAIRYTLQYDEASYAQGVRGDVEIMKGKGLQLLRLKNLWSGSEYKGINSQWLHRETNQNFELQFHTLASFEAKQVTHGAYERLRSLHTTDTQSAEDGKLHEYQREVCARIPIPPGSLDIPDYP